MRIISSFIQSTFNSWTDLSLLRWKGGEVCWKEEDFKTDGASEGSAAS